MLLCEQRKSLCTFWTIFLRLAYETGLGHSSTPEVAAEVEETAATAEVYRSRKAAAAAPYFLHEEENCVHMSLKCASNSLEKR